MKTLALCILLSVSASAKAAFDIELTVSLPQGQLVPPGTTVPLDVTLRNLGPDSAQTRGIATFYFAGAPKNTIALVEGSDTAPCTFGITDISVRPGLPVPILASIFPPQTVLAAGESVSCRVVLGTFFDSPNQVNQIFSTPVDPGDSNLHNNRTVLSIVVRNPPVAVPTHSALNLWLLTLALLLPGIRQLRPSLTPLA